MFDLGMEGMGCGGPGSSFFIHSIIPNVIDFNLNVSFLICWWGFDSAFNEFKIKWGGEFLCLDFLNSGFLESIIYIHSVLISLCNIRSQEAPLWNGFQQVLNNKKFVKTFCILFFSYSWKEKISATVQWIFSCCEKLLNKFFLFFLLKSTSIPHFLLGVSNNRQKAWKAKQKSNKKSLL